MSTRFALFNSHHCELDSRTTNFTEEHQAALRDVLISFINGSVIAVGDYITITEVYEDD